MTTRLHDSAFINVPATVTPEDAQVIVAEVAILMK